MGSESEAYDSASFLKEAAEWKPSKGGLPLAAALAGALLLHHLGSRVKDNEQEAQFGQQMNRLAESNRNAGDNANLMGGGQLSFPGAMAYQATMADSNTPNFSELDKTSADIVANAGRILAKQASIGGATLNAIGAVNKAPNMLLKGIQSVAKPVLGAVSKITPSMGLGTKILGGAALAGTGLLAAKAGKKALEFGNQPAPERRMGAPGPGLPRFVNEYGVPE